MLKTHGAVNQLSVCLRAMLYIVTMVMARLHAVFPVFVVYKPQMCLRLKWMLTIIIKDFAS